MSYPIHPASSKNVLCWLKVESHSISKYTTDYCHLERCTPSLPDSLLLHQNVDANGDPSTPVIDPEVYKALESPKHYYTTMAGSTSSSSLVRPREATLTGTGPTSRPVGGGGGGGDTSPQQRTRALSRTSTLQPAVGLGKANGHIDASEPRGFPGVMQERERRRSMRVGSISASGSDGGGGGIADWMGGSVGSLRGQMRDMTVQEETGNENEYDEGDAHGSDGDGSD